MTRIASALAAAVLLVAGAAPARAAFEHAAYAAELASYLAKNCPMAAPDDIKAHESCRQSMGQGPEKLWRGYHFLFGGEQPAKTWLKDKKTTIFRGDLFQNLYMSLFMFTGKYDVQRTKDGLYSVRFQAYFRNNLPPGAYPYPFWHSAEKWDAYEKANDIRLRMDANGKVVFAHRADTGTNENRGPYKHVERPAFLGEWMWRDDAGGAQPYMTLFGGYYSKDNPNLNALDTSYRKFARGLRDADCTVCHQPEGHSRMNKLTLLQTPLHAATSIGAVLEDVRSNRMPVDDHGDRKALAPTLKKRLLDEGGEFKALLDAADAWEKANGRPRAFQATTR